MSTDTSKTAHTPGPWSMRATPESSNHDFAVDIGRDYVGLFVEADARLIAAAPELLEALQDAIAAVKVFHGPVAWDTYWNHSPECKRWRAAIAKATGG